jgi:hypothetical protein
MVALLLLGAKKVWLQHIQLLAEEDSTRNFSYSSNTLIDKTFLTISSISRFAVTLHTQTALMSKREIRITDTAQGEGEERRTPAGCGPRQ